MKDIAASILARLKNQAKETGAVKRMNIAVTVDLAGAEHKIDENNKVTKKRIAKEASVSEKTIERQMKKTTNVKYIGRRYSGHWEIKN